MNVLATLFEALALAVGMAWETWWALVLGFTLTGVVSEFVSADAMTRYVGDDDWETIGLTAAFGAASSSCSYSASSTARVLVEKGASFAAAIAFMFASTDLVVELGLVMWILLGWQFVAADLFGGVVAVFVVAALFRRYVPDEWVETARLNAAAFGETTCSACGMEAPPEAEDTVTGEVDGVVHHFCCGGCERAYTAGEMASDDGDGGLASTSGWRQAGRNAVREWDMLWEDIALGFLLAGALEAFVPRSFWLDLFSIGGSSGVSWVVVSVVVATVVGVVTFLCSVGNVPFALVLWNNGVAFGGVLAFIYADLVIPPLVSAYRRYYGTRMAATIFVVLFLAAVVAGVVVHYVFGFAGLIPPAGEVGGTAPDWYTLPLNVVFTAVFFAELYVTYGAQTLGEAALRVPDALATGLVVAAMASGFLAGGLATTRDLADDGSGVFETVAAGLDATADRLDDWTDAARDRLREWS